MNVNTTQHHFGTMPDGQPAPTVMTPGEAIAFLRLDQTGIKDPLLSLRYYPREGPTQGGQDRTEAPVSPDGLVGFPGASGRGIMTVKYQPQHEFLLSQ